MEDLSANDRDMRGRGFVLRRRFVSVWQGSSICSFIMRTHWQSLLLSSAGALHAHWRIVHDNEIKTECDVSGLRSIYNTHRPLN